MSRLDGRLSLAAIFLSLTGTFVHAASGNKTMKLEDVAVGKYIQVGNVKFVKVSTDKYLALDLCPTGSTYSSYFKGCVIKTTTFSYTGDYQTFTAPATGPYVVELWGAQGGCYGNQCAGMRGGYTAGLIDLTARESYYVYVGEGLAQMNGAGFNVATGSSGGGNPGGGASDIRVNSGDWRDDISLNSRLMVAAGGGAIRLDSGAQYNLGHAGGLIGYATRSDKLGGTQTEAGSVRDYACASGGVITNGFGIAAACGATGGGGYYAGSGGAHATGGGAGGSSYISGHTGCVAIAEGSTTNPRAVKITGCVTGTTDNACSIHYSGKYFTNTVMIDGAGYSWTNTKGTLTPMPDPTSVGSYYASGVGHTGNGAARITQLSVYLGI